MDRSLLIRKVVRRSGNKPSIALNIDELKNQMDLTEHFISAITKHGDRTTIRFGEQLRNRPSNSYYIDNTYRCNKVIRYNIMTNLSCQKLLHTVPTPIGLLDVLKQVQSGSRYNSHKIRCQFLSICRAELCDPTSRVMDRNARKWNYLITRNGWSRITKGTCPFVGARRMQPAIQNVPPTANLTGATYFQATVFPWKSV